MTNVKCTFTFSVFSLFVGVLPRRHSVTMSTEVCGEFSGVCCWFGPRSQKSSTAEWTRGSHQTITSQRYRNKGGDHQDGESVDFGGGGGGMLMRSFGLQTEKGKCLQMCYTIEYCLSRVIRLSILSS